jgi:hypothetical protein
MRLRGGGVMGSLKPGSRVWTRHLVSVTPGPYGDLIPEASYSTEYPRPAFRCSFVGMSGEKHILVNGPDGRLFETHRGRAYQNPAATLWWFRSPSPRRPPHWGFVSPWADLGGAVDRHVHPRALAHIPGTSVPDETTFLGYCKRY